MANWLRCLLRFKIPPITADTFIAALENHHRYGISHWDALIVASAQEAECVTLFTEDLNHGQNYRGVTAHNPFRQSPGK